MQLPLATAALLAGQLLGQPAVATASNDPFQAIDPQHWVNPDNMTWDDFKAPPGTKWNDPSRKGSSRNFNIALVALDFPDKSFVATGKPHSNLFGNPQPNGANVPRKDVPTFYRDMLNKPGELNKGHTLHEYWMEDSQGRYGVELTSFGPYQMPWLSYEYGIDDFNPGACPPGKNCSQDVRHDGHDLWLADVGNKTASSFELVFYLTAGEDESSVWQEFGEMKFNSKEDIPDAWGPPKDVNASLPNYGPTRYVDWTSWAAGAASWANAGDGSTIQCESDGMGTFAHELSHLLFIGDNYNNPYGNPLRRAYTGPWSMMSRGTFNGPGGPHSRYHVPALNGGSMGSLHTVRDKLQLGLISNDSIIKISRDALAASGPLVTRITARSVVSKQMGLRIEMDADRSPKCDIAKDVFCDGGGWEAYDVEVIDRMGADSFQPDSGVMISKTIKDGWTDPFQWTIDANPEDIKLVDFVRPNGTAAMITLGDYRQLADALFHAGTRSGSQYEHVDEPNGLHFYIINLQRDKSGVLSYDVGVRSLNSTNKSEYGVKLSSGRSSHDKPTEKGAVCTFDLTNNGTYASGEHTHKTWPHIWAPTFSG
ncbi:Putative secreted metallopeptidase [Cladobotryum mycophilum]|uniref:Secreted metallopeptidase n=1 Tax=Cladobotryum mycophilum TaxID=491253 RepID=A0ABR0S8V9_9HYPO